MSVAGSVTLPMGRYLRDVHTRLARLFDGSVADYISSLAAADPDRFGMCVATVDGEPCEVGDTDVAFTIQSIPKPLIYALADPALLDIAHEALGRATREIAALAR